MKRFLIDLYAFTEMMMVLLTIGLAANYPVWSVITALIALVMVLPLYHEQKRLEDEL